MIMARPTSRLVCRALLVGFALGALGWLAGLDYNAKISTSVLDLIPPGEQAREVLVMRSLAEGPQAQVLLLALRDPESPPRPMGAFASMFADELRRSPAIAEAVALGGSASDEALGRALFEHRLRWLLPSWLSRRHREYEAEPGAKDGFPAWLADRAAGDLERFLARPEAVAMQELLSRDPLLLLPALARQGEKLLSPGGGGREGLIWARIHGSPFAEEGQAPVFAAIERARVAAGIDRERLELRWTGLNRFAAASRARIESEVRWLNLFSLVAVVLCSSLFVRRIHQLLHLVPVMLFSLLGAWTVTTLVFDRTHILVFVLGSVLGGVAIDYGFYIFMQPPAHAEESYAGKLRRLLPSLLASCLTTTLGFLLMVFSDLPLIRQLGVFVAAGLVCALGAAMLYFGQLQRPQLEARSLPPPPRLLRSRPGRILFRTLAACAAGAALTGPWLVSWRDDIRQLDLPAEDLRANDASIRARFGDHADGSVFITVAPSLAEARRKLADFHAWIGTAEGRNPGASLGLIIPTEQEVESLRARVVSLETFPAEFREALGRRGMIADYFEPFLDDWRQLLGQAPETDYQALVAEIDRKLGGPFALLANLRSPPFWFLTRLGERVPAAPPADLGTIGVDQLSSLNDLLGRYRWSALRLSLVGLALVIASVFCIYPSRRGLRIALIPAGSCFLVFGAFGLVGQPLNLFHLLGGFLGICLAHNYAIFSDETSANAKSPPVPVRLSAISTAASFGVLAFSGIPVVSALGITVGLIALSALIVIEVEPLLSANHS
jgi:predicted exporter